MADIRRIVDLYELDGPYKKVARELSISPNTAKKYWRRVKNLQEGAVEEILPKNRKIIQPSSSLLCPDSLDQQNCDSAFGFP